MSNEFELTAESRSDTGKGASRRLRRLHGRIPAIIYGGHADPVMVSLETRELKKALETEAFYIGAIGSRRNNDARHQRMAEHFDLSEAKLERMRGPIGIYIGSKTPSEIAVSVMAEVLAVKNGVVLPRDMEVAQAKNERAVLHNDPGELVCGIKR